MDSFTLLHDTYAQARHQTLIAEADLARQQRAAQTAHPVNAGLVRRHIGATLVWAGEIVQGPQYAKQAA